MYKKICTLWHKFWTLKGHIIVFIFFYVIGLSLMIAIPTANNRWEKLMSYPETNYQELEDEASRIIKSNNFDTDYRLHIQNYNNVTNYLCFDLSDDSASVTATVENYKKDNQVSNIERMYESSRELFASNLLGIFGFPLLFSLLAFSILMLVFSLFMFLARILEKKLTA